MPVVLSEVSVPVVMRREGMVTMVMMPAVLLLLMLSTTSLTRCAGSQVITRLHRLLVNPLHDSREHEVHVHDPLVKRTQELLSTDQQVLVRASSHIVSCFPVVNQQHE